jgi:molecular chaperone HscB
LHDEVTQARQHALQQCEQLIDVAHDLPQAAQQVRALMFIERFAQDIETRLDALE